MIRFFRRIFTLDQPSPADIVPSESISAKGTKLTIDFSKLNIPFTEDPALINIWEIPDTNSMDGIMDTGNNYYTLQPANERNDKIMLDWIADQWLKSKGFQTIDAIYRIMANPQDNPLDYSQPHKFYAIHRLIKVGQDSKGRYFIFRGFNNWFRDPYKVREKNILFLSAGIIY